MSKELLITPEDVAAAFEFWDQFNIPMPAELKAAEDAFKANPTFENQEALKFHLLQAIITTNHEAFTDSSFKPIFDQCNEHYQHLSFTRELEAELAKKED